MKNEFCFNVDEDDNIIGTLNKFQSHTIDPVSGKAPLHRAFSVFLLKETPSSSTGTATEFELILQQRSEYKLTFPLMWANSCCSHPIDGLKESEDTVDVLTGVARAATRKLHHELGIPLEITRKNTFYHYNRIHYHAPSQNHQLGEHEIDHTLLMRVNEELVQSINLNLNEVKEIKFVPIGELHTISNPTPWLQKIINCNLLSEWICDFSKNHSSSTTPQIISRTKYSNDPIIKL